MSHEKQVSSVSLIERKWIGVGTGALGALAFDDEATALQYAQDCGAGEVVEYVPAEQHRGAVEALREMTADRDRWRHEYRIEKQKNVLLRSDLRRERAAGGQ